MGDIEVRGGRAGTDRARPSPSRATGTDHLVAVALLFTAIAHLVEVGPHWSEGTILGLFFLVSTIVLFLQVGMVAARPGPVVHLSAVLTSLVLIGLYFLAREVSLPGVDHHDPYLARDIPVKAAEALVVVAGTLRARSLRAGARAAGAGAAGAGGIPATTAGDEAPLLIRPGVGVV